ncbi:serine hydrolase domain-containing protein [Crenalkalicoccus roseus]|uniref:serine hydrolase domain-containing protein n=1 Tax=Crenalkalicoccus roseus TaxID=1485588 RepID=UPI0010813A38|nr:serine hydrolase domain-containing protein [Crenalkalicoccus roseus]
MAELGLLALRRAARRLLAPFEGARAPGAALGLVRGGALVLHEGAGMASIELGVPIGPETCFRIASVSKQFTCAAILLLAREGRLSPEDDIRAHLPELPDLRARITLDHLMRNTSGLRDVLELMRMGGADLSQPCGTEHLLAAILRQRGLNFPPGSRFLYSNTGFLLLGQVVERVAGEPLGAFLERRILLPLGMTRTRLTPEAEAVVPGLATGYLPREGGFVQARHGFPLGGEGGLVSCVEDLALWDRALATGHVIGRDLAEALTMQAPFANGRMNRYARGLEVGEYRGLRTVDHGGLWPGFRSAFLRVPDLSLTVIALANHGGVDPHLLAQQLLDAAVEGLPGVRPAPAPPPRAALEPLLGRWIEPETATTLEFSLTGAGELQAVQHGVPFALVPTGDGRLTARRGGFPFLVAPPEGGELVVETSAGTLSRFRRAPEGAALPADLAGPWRCAELDAAWSIAPEGGEMAARVRGPLVSAGPWRITPVAPDAFRVHVPGTLFPGWLDGRVLRDAAGRAEALSVSGGRARDLRFAREPA